MIQAVRLTEQQNTVRGTLIYDLPSLCEGVVSSVCFSSEKASASEWLKFALFSLSHLQLRIPLTSCRNSVLTNAKSKGSMHDDICAID